MAAVGTLAMAMVAGGSVLGSGTYLHSLPGTWFFDVPAPATGAAAAAALVLVYGGAVLLVRSWLAVARSVRGGRVRTAVVVVALWTVPLLALPPLFSRDAYSYAAQGELVTHHVDPYDHGPAALGPGLLLSAVDPLWRDAASPYGPLFLSIDGELYRVSGGRVPVDLALLRLLELAGVGLIALAVPTLARAAGRDPAEAVVLAAGSPLVLFSVVGGAHQDGLMVGLMVAGLAVARRVGTVPGVALCALGAAVKAPAIAGAAFVGWARAGPRRRSGLWWLAVAGVVALATLAAVAAGTGLGWGWVGTLSTPGHVWTWLTPLNLVAAVITGIAHLFRLPVALHSVGAVLHVLGVVVAAATGLALLWRAPRLGVELALGLALLVLALLGPTLQMWYLVWALVPLGAVATGRLLRVTVALAAVAGLLSLTGVVQLLHALRATGIAGIVVVALAVVLAALAPGDRRRLARGLVRPRPPAT